MTEGKEGHAAGRGRGCAKGRVVLSGAASDPCPAPSSAVPECPLLLCVQRWLGTSGQRGEGSRPGVPGELRDPSAGVLALLGRGSQGRLLAEQETGRALLLLEHQA